MRLTREREPAPAPLHTAGWVWPVPIAADGRRPTISDGFHAAGDMRFRGGLGHRGQDVMYRKRWPSAPKHPWSSRWFEMLPRTPAIAAQDGMVYRCGKLTTGFHVVLEHDHGVATAYHHLSDVVPHLSAGTLVHAGQALGTVGGSPVGYGLVHLHFDVNIGGKFVDAAEAMRGWGFVRLVDAWGTVGRVE